MTTFQLRLDGVGKDYAKVDARGGRVRLVWDLLRGRAAARVFRALDGVDLDELGAAFKDVPPEELERQVRKAIAGVRSEGRPAAKRRAKASLTIATRGAGDASTPCRNPSCRSSMMEIVEKIAVKSTMSASDPGK